MIKYGTSGFRTHNTTILKIAEKIGLAMAQLVYYKKESFGIMITASHNHHEDNGVKILVDTKSYLYLVGTTLNYSGGLNGKGFIFENPNANRTCGCGESFSL